MYSRLRVAAASWLLLCTTAVAADPVADAYAAQDALVRSWDRNERIAGYKSAFGSAALQQRFGLDGPASAVLPASAQRCTDVASDCVVALEGYQRAALEVEIALRLGCDLTQPPDSASTLLACIEQVMLAVELPELALAGVVAPRGTDIIAGNIGTRNFLLGEPYLPAILQGDAIHLRLLGAEATLTQGDATAALESALQLVRAIVARGYTVRAGHVLLTGVVGSVVDAAPGVYRAEGTGLGARVFRLQ